MNSDASEFVRRYEALARKLESCPQVGRYDTAEDKAAWTMAHGILDLEESFAKLSRVLFKKLHEQELSGDELQDLLHEIGEEFRHIYYHMTDMRYFAPFLDTGTSRATNDD